MATEIQTLRQLEQDVQDLYTIIKEQRSIISGLAHQSILAGKDEIKQCDGGLCVVKKMYKHAKMCMHIFYVQYGPSNQLAAFSKSIDALGNTTSSNSSDRSIDTVQRQRLYKNLRICSGQTTQAELSTVNATTTTTIASAILETQPHETIFWILAILGTLFSFLCIAKVIYHCHNDPRRRAERAARREERRRTREYRRAARWAALMNIWHWRKPKRVGDYEEKRSLILAQENVLEGVMQQEITQLRLAHGIVEDMVHAAEEGRLPTVDDIGRVIAADRMSRRSTGPPTYRSRASSSAQPPSYHTDDDDAVVSVANGYCYTPNGTYLTPEGTDVTPESSVVNLSPRNSFDTLRTLYSTV